MGMRLRLKEKVDISSFFSAQSGDSDGAEKYGLILADNGSAMFITALLTAVGNNDDLHDFGNPDRFRLRSRPDGHGLHAVQRSHRTLAHDRRITANPKAVICRTTVTPDMDH